MPVTNIILEYAQIFVSDARRCMAFLLYTCSGYTCSSLLRRSVMPELIRNNKSINTSPAAYSAW